MKALVLYESFFGNTEKIAQAIGDSLGSSMEVDVRKVSEFLPEQLNGLSLLCVMCAVKWWNGVNMGLKAARMDDCWIAQRLRKNIL